MRWIIGLTVALLCANGTPERDLVLVANITRSATDFGTILIDAGSVQADSNRRTFWSYMFVRNGDLLVRGANYTEADCGNQTIRYVKRQMFDDSHVEIGEKDKPTSWSHAAKDSAELRMIRLACGTEKPIDAEKLGDVDPLAISDPLLTNPKFR
jgi:hypothetical protein